MAQSFFSNLQGWVKSEFGVDYGGRYIGQLLKQIADFDPLPFRQFFASVVSDPAYRRGQIRIETEVNFPIRGRSRRADLVVYLDDAPRLLVELKYRDRLVEGRGPKSSQLDDYLAICRGLASKPKFLLLHREPQEPADVRQIERAGHVVAQYQELVPFLKTSKNPISEMFIGYLQAEGLVIDPIDTDHLYRFFHRLVLPREGGGHINKTSEIGEGPAQFQRLLNNMRLITTDVTPTIRMAIGAWGARSATVDFSLDHRYSRKQISRLTAKAGKAEVDIDNDARTGGNVDVWAQSALIYSSRRWLYLYYGLQFMLTKGKPLKVDVYAYLSSPEIAKASENNIFDDRFSACGTLSVRRLRSWKKGELEEDFLGLIRDCVKSTLRAGVLTDRRSISVLRRLRRI